MSPGGAAPRRVHLLLTLGAVLFLCACTGSEPVRSAPPATPSTPPATVRPPQTGASKVTPTPAVIDPVTGAHERRAPWRLISATDSELVVEVQAGGQPCDAVTGVDVTESAQTVAVTVWTGRTPDANCPGQPALLGTFWVRVPLNAPLAGRSPVAA